MSPQTRNRWKEAAQSVCAIVVLLALFWIVRSGIFTRGNSGDGVLGMFGPATTDNGNSYVDYSGPDGVYADEEQDAIYGEIFSMPVCADLNWSIEALLDARNNLLSVAVDQDSQAIRAAAVEYGVAVRNVQTGFATLKMRLEPDEFEYVSQVLRAPHDQGDGQALRPCELGPFAEDLCQ